MIVVSNTSPINYLILTGNINCLESLFERIIIPSGVKLELQHPRAPSEVGNWISHPPTWLDIKPAKESLVSPQKRLGNGELQAIALALELSADALLIDDRDGILEARRHDLVTLGALSVLERAAERNLVELAEALYRLKQTSFRMPPLDVLEAMLTRDEERMTRR